MSRPSSATFAPLPEDKVIGRVSKLSPAQQNELERLVLAGRARVYRPVTRLGPREPLRWEWRR